MDYPNECTCGGPSKGKEGKCDHPKCVYCGEPSTDGVCRKCEDDRIPFFMKQMSGNTKKQLEAIPDHLMIQEFPE